MSSHLENNQDPPINPNINFKNRKEFRRAVGNEPAIESFHQITRVEGERVMNAFKEGTIMAFKIWDMKDFIQAKTGIKVSEKFCLRIRDKDYNENKQWYYSFAKDQKAYLGAYRKAIDEVQLYKDHFWRIILRPSATDEAKIAALKELHNLTKTSVLLLRDLPFIMRLSNYYEIDKIDKDGDTIARLGYSRSNEKEQGLLLQSNETAYANKNTNIVNAILNNPTSETLEPLQDDIMLEMQKQIPKDPLLDEKVKGTIDSINNDIAALKAKYENSILNNEEIQLSKDHIETIKKLNELKDVNNNE